MKLKKGAMISFFCNDVEYVKVLTFTPMKIGDGCIGRGRSIRMTETHHHH